MNKGIVAVAVGSLMIVSALSLALYNIRSDKKSGEYAQELLVKIKEELPVTSMAVTEITTDEEEYSFFDQYISRDDPTYYEQPQEAVINIDGDFYSGIVSIPTLSLELPVYRDLDYENLKYSPCRYKGSVAEGNIIIAAHNYSSHFGHIDNMISGDRIYFTDAQGMVYEYEVITTEVVDGTDIDAMEAGSEEWDMTIFTCNLSGMSRIAVRATAV